MFVAACQANPCNSLNLPWNQHNVSMVAIGGGSECDFWIDFPCQITTIWFCQKGLRFEQDSLNNLFHIHTGFEANESNNIVIKISDECKHGYGFIKGKHGTKL